MRLSERLYECVRESVDVSVYEGVRVYVSVYERVSVRLCVCVTSEAGGYRTNVCPYEFQVGETQ